MTAKFVPAELDRSPQSGDVNLDHVVHTEHHERDDSPFPFLRATLSDGSIATIRADRFEQVGRYHPCPPWLVDRSLAGRKPTRQLARNSYSRVARRLSR